MKGTQSLITSYYCSDYRNVVVDGFTFDEWTAWLAAFSLLSSKCYWQVLWFIQNLSPLVLWRHCCCHCCFYLFPLAVLKCCLLQCCHSINACLVSWKAWFSLKIYPVVISCMCVHVRAHTCGCTCVHVHIEARGWHWVFTLIISTSFSETESLTEPGD